MTQIEASPRLGPLVSLSPPHRALRPQASYRPARGHSRVAPAPEPHAFYDVSKRAIDVIGGLALGALAVPVVGAAAVAVYATARTNPFFIQERVGLAGRRFPMLKIKTMRDGADREVPRELNEAGGPAFKARNDPRVTRIGRFLRKTSIDEAPQFLNVIAGQMSLVGPRPPIPTEVARYTRPQMQRLTVKPGLSCIWQVSGRSNIRFTEWVAMDRLYIRKRSLALDLALLARTPWAVATMKGAH